MAVAKQDSGSKKNTNTTKEQNKQAIQNINRTGTVSGKSSGVKGSSNVVRTNTDTSNLAGNNRQQAYGTPKMTSPSKVNVMGKASKQEKGKTFVPETNTPTVSTVNTNLRKNQSTLSSMADDSTKKANDVLNGISNAYNSFMENLKTPTKRTQQREEYKQQRTQAKLDAVNKENMDLANQTTDEDYRRMYDANGQRIDNSQQKKDLQDQIAQLDTYISEIGDEAVTAAELARRNELQAQLDEFDLLDRKAQALEELYAQKTLNGDDLSSYQEMISHKNDNIFERFGNVMNHLGNTTANIIPTAFDQMKETRSNAYAKENIAELDRLHEIGEIDDELYKESLSEWQDYIDRHKSTNSDNLSQIIRANADAINANTYYGANEIERFVLQAGESTAQFLLHYALLGEAATISMSLTSGTEKMNQLLLEGVDPGTAAMNGFMTGLVSYVTEKIGMDRFVNMMGTPFSADALGSILLSHFKSGVSEGLEEVAEGLVDPLIDAYTLGKPYEVNGNELWMEFLLGGASGLAMAFGGTAIGTVNTAVQINSLLNERRGVRADVQNQIGQLVVNSQYQKNLLINEINKFKEHFNSMTDTQKQVATELISKGQNAIEEYDMKSQVQGVTFSADIPYETTSEENNHAIFETYTPDFNSEVQFEQKIAETESIINDLMDSQLSIENVANQTQQILNENGYDIDAKVFNSLSSEQQQKALVALDFANIMGMNVNVVNNLPKGQSGFVDSKGNITIDASKNPVLYTLSHELTHGTESSKFYDSLKNLVMSNIEGDWNELVNKKIEDYAKGNIPLDFENAEKEVVARYVEDKLGDEKFIEDLIKYNYSVASRIYQDLKSMGSDDEVVKIRNAFEKAFNDNYQQNSDKFSFVGQETINRMQEYADKYQNKEAQDLVDALNENAKIAWGLYKQGVSNEDIYRETRMYFGKDGLLRFEIADDVDNIVRNFPTEANKEYRLTDIYGKDGVLALFPKLRDIKVKTVYDSNEKSFSGKYSNKNNTITLNLAKANPGTVIHELQHAIQIEEHFDIGTSKGAELYNLWREFLGGKSDWSKFKYLFGTENDYIKGRYRYNTGEIEARDARNRAFGMNDGQIPDMASGVFENDIRKYYPNGRGNSFAETNTEDNISVDDEKTRKDVGREYRIDSNGLRYSFDSDNNLPDTDSDGDKLSPNQREFFRNSKVLDEDGNLMVMYHSSPSEQFYIFDKGKASAEGNMGAGFYFTNDSYDARSNYHEGGPDIENRIERLADRLEYDEEISHEEALERAREEVIKGEGTDFEVYLNITNPVYVGNNETQLMTPDTVIEYARDMGYLEENVEEFSDEFYEAMDSALYEYVDDILSEIGTRYEGIDEVRQILYDSYYNEGTTLEDLKAKLNELYLTDDEGNLVSNEIARQIVENMGYDGIIDSSVSDKFSGMRLGGWTVHAIAFNENQIKNTDNLDPTENKDIRYSADFDSPLGETEMSDEQMNLKKKVPSSKDIEKGKTAKVLESAPKKETTLKEAFNNAKTEIKNKTVSKYAAIENIAEKSKNKNIIPLLDEVMRSAGRAERSIYEGLYDKSGTKKIGKSLTEIMGDIPKQFRQSFGEYIYHWRNIDEMTMEERHAEELKDARKELSTLEEKRKAVPKKQKKEYTEQIKELRKKISKLESYKNRPVFGEDVTAEDSMDRISEIEQTHPEFKKIAEDLWKLNQQYLKMRQDSGIISEDTYNQFVADRPHYTPIIRDIGPGYVSGANPNDIKKFKGSNRDIYPVEEAMRRHILKSWEVTSQNELNKELMKELGGAEELEADDALDLIEDGYVPTESNSSGNQMYAYSDGKKMSIPVSEELYESLVPPKNKNSNLKDLADKTIAKASKLRKSVLTSGNPLFSLLTNPIKDIQDAFGQTKYRGKLGENYAKFLAKAIDEVVNDGEISKQYDNLGIGQGQYISKDMYEAIEKMDADKGLKKAWNSIFELGEKIEKIPRLAEFMASLDAGNSPQQAAYDAAEVTTNFKRGGTWVKNADKYGFPFLNASVQGFDKQVRNAKGDIETIKNNGIKGAISVLARLTLAAGIPLRILQDWIWKDDDEYKELSDYIKSNYYIIPNLFAKDKKFGNRFLRIPKGRVAAFWQTVLTGGYDLVKQQTDVWDMLLDDWKSFADNIAPNKVSDSFIGSPLIQAFGSKEGKSWYGEDIVPTRLQDDMASEQYDASTDLISIKLGELSRLIAEKTKNDKFQLSPYKINYVLDQYGGFLGDIVLPAFTLETDVGINNPIGKALASPLLDKFTTDPVLKNQNVSTFYDLMDEIKTKSSSKYAKPEQQLAYKYLSSVATEMGKLYGEKRDIQGSKEFTNKEKIEKTRKIQQEINVFAKAGLANYDNIDIEGKYAAVGGVQYYQSEDGSWRKTRKETLEKMNKADLSMEDRNYFYETNEQISNIRDEIKKNTPEGQRADYAKDTIDAINNSKLSAKGKNTLYDSFYTGKATDHINSMDLSDEQKYDLKTAYQLAEGKKDKNGKTISNSKAEATAEAYDKLGLLDDVLKYIKDNDIAPSELGLSKTVFNKLIKSNSYQSAYNSSMNKKSSNGSKKSSNKTSKSSGVSGGGSTRSGGKLNKLGPVTKKSQIDDRKIANGVTNYMRAYSSVFNRSGKKPNTGGRGTSVICPRCGSSVSSSNGKCPVCGANL